AQSFFVLDDEDGAGGRSILSFANGGRSRARATPFRRRRQIDLKQSPRARGTHQVDSSFMFPHDPLNDRKPKTAAGELGAEERIEYLGLHFFCHSDAAI